MLDKLNTILQSCDAKVTAATLNAKLLATVTVDNPADVLKEAKDFYEEVPAACSGWLCFTDKVQIVTDEYRFADGDSRILLSGEMARGDISLHIRQSDNGWQLVELTRSDWGEMLMIQEDFLSIYKEGKKLRYENYWHRGKNKEGLDVYQPFTSRFAGFAGGK